jgi:hypothetical protein
VIPRYIGSLFFLFWIIANVLELTLSYFARYYTGVQATGAWLYSVDSAWYAMALNQIIISCLVGLALFYVARYGVLFGLTIAMYALCVYQGYQLLKIMG